MKIDLSLPLNEELIRRNHTLQDDEVLFRGINHIGTHFDIINQSFSLDYTELQGRIFDVSHIRDRDIDISDIDRKRIQPRDFVIFHTGFVAEVGYATPEYKDSHPQLSKKLIDQLVEDCKVWIIGIDAAGVRRHPDHQIADRFCAEHGVYVVENLDNTAGLLAETGGEGFIVHTYPLNITDMTGIPCRVVAEIPK